MNNGDNMKTMHDLIQKAKSQEKKTLVVAVAEDKAVMEAVEMARQEGFIDAVLYGDESKILETLSDLGLNKNDYVIHHSSDAKEASYEAVKHVSSHPKHFLMKGLVDTSVILKAALDKEIGLRTDKRISHVSVFEIAHYHKLLAMSDGAMNIAPNVDEKQEIIENASVILNALGIDKPKVGCIGAVEKVNPKMQATLDAKTLEERSKEGKMKGIEVEGPFGLDNAVSLEAAKQKGIDSNVAGDVDLLLMPMIEAGNVFYKSMMFLAGAKSASVIAGASRPIVLTSRADSKASKFYSIALSALVAELQ